MDPLLRFYRNVIDHMDSGVSVFRAVRDPETDAILDFEWVLANRYTERLSGRSPSSFIGRRMLEEIPEHVPLGLFDLYCGVVESGEDAHTTIELDHELVRGALSIRATKLLDGVVVAYADVTEAVATKREVMLSAERLLVATEAAELGIWERDLTTGEAIWDDTTRALYGVPAGETLAFEQWRQCIHEDDLAGLDQAFKEALKRADEVSRVCRDFVCDALVEVIDADAVSGRPQ